jgi:hypothetical protein
VSHDVSHARSASAMGLPVRKPALGDDVVHAMEGTVSWSRQAGVGCGLIPGHRAATSRAANAAASVTTGVAPPVGKPSELELEHLFDLWQAWVVRRMPPASVTGARPRNGPPDDPRAILEESAAGYAEACPSGALGPRRPCSPTRVTPRRQVGQTVRVAATPLPMFTM